MLDFRVNTFLAVCQTLNFTQASKELGLTQPAVSQHIKLLENFYHTRLFHYENKKLTLTAAGQLLLERFTTMQNDENALLEELSSQDTGIETLSLGVTMTIGEYAIISPLAKFLKEHPNLNINLRFGNTQQLLQLMSEGKIQLALVEGSYPRENYDYVNYSTEGYIGVCASGHAFHYGQPHSFQDLLSERLLVREHGSGTRNILEKNLALQELTIQDFKHFIEIENMHTIIGMVLQDCGITFLYRIAVTEELAQGRLQEICLDDVIMKHDFDFIWEKGSIYSHKYRHFIQELSQNH